MIRPYFALAECRMQRAEDKEAWRWVLRMREWRDGGVFTC